MSGSTNVLSKATSLDVSPAFSPFTGVRLWYDDENVIFSGDETGRVLEADCPWATQEIADSVLAAIRGYVYQPFTAQTAILDPVAELGDGVNVGGVYGPLAVINATFGSMFSAEIGAPQDEELDHEYPYLSGAERKFKRQIATTRSLITKTAEEIQLEVHKLEENTELSLEEMEKTFEENLEELEKAFGKDLDDLAGNITETLEQYSTIAQTAEKIELAVNTSKEYTNQKTGEVVASLDKYSTIAQTDSKISLTVSESKQYTDQKTGEIAKSLENYSTIEQTASSIEAAVRGKIDEEYANSLISQKMNSIELSVSSGDGSTTLKLTGGGVELSSQTVELSVDALNIHGKINAEQLNLTGSITFGDLDSDTQDQINDRGISASRARTIINDELVSSPNIAGGKFWDIEQENWIEMGEALDGRVAYFNHYYSGYSSSEPVCVMGYYDPTGRSPNWVLAPFNDIVLDYVSGTMYVTGEWDFSQADVTGLSGSGGSDSTALIVPVWG